MPNLPEVAPLGYEPLAEAWICALHGQPDCAHAECRGLPWAATQDPAFGPFLDWADEQFCAIIAPFDRGEVDEMPDEAFDAYFPNDWTADA